MKIKTCSNGHKITTKNAERVIRHETGLYFNCPCCKSTLFLRDKKFNFKGALLEKN